jgi:chorismate mutase
MSIRGVRGATTAETNSKEAILEATRELLEQLLANNNIQQEDIASIFFSVTHDLNAEFPAIAARQIGLTQAPLLCLNEIDVPNSLERCVRILMHVNTPKPQTDIQHSYLKGAVVLRPDFAGKS